MGTWGRAWRIEEIRDYLDHKDVKTTQRYAHLSPDHLHRAARETRQDPTLVPRVVLSPYAPSGSGHFPKQLDGGSSPPAVIDGKDPSGHPPGVGRTWDFKEAQQVAAELLRLVAGKEGVSREVLLRLAEAGGAQHERLAYEVRAGGPYALRAAVELAALLLGATGSAEGTAR